MEDTVLARQLLQDILDPRQLVGALCQDCQGVSSLVLLHIRGQLAEQVREAPGVALLQSVLHLLALELLDADEGAIHHTAQCSCRKEVSLIALCVWACTRWPRGACRGGSLLAAGAC